MQPTATLVFMRYLTKSGLFENDCEHVTIKFEKFELRFLHNSKLGQIYCETVGQTTRLFKLYYISSNVGFGIRRFFFDEYSEILYDPLIVFEERLYSRERFFSTEVGLSILQKRALIKAANLRAKCWLPPNASKRLITNARRRMLLSVPEQERSLLPLNTLDQLSSTRNAHKDTETVSTSTQFAIDHGAEPRHWDNEGFRRQTSKDVDREYSDLQKIAHQSPASIANFCKINVSALRKSKLLVAGELNLLWLGWEEKKTDGAEILIACDLRDPAFMLCTFEFHYKDASKFHAHTSRVYIRGNNRIYFRCPIDKRECSSLYLRNGIFASRQAHNLFYPSQAKAKRRTSR